MANFEYKVDVPALDGSDMEPVVLSLKPIALCPIGVLRHNRRNPEAQMWDMFEWGISEDQLPTFDRVPASEMEKILVAWQDDEGNGVEAGESDASSPSSKGTGRRSKRTSSETDSA